MDSTAAPVRKRGRTVRWLGRLGIAVAVLAIALAAMLLWMSHRSRVSLDEAIAEVDRADPNWRIADLEANRILIADDQNAALEILALVERLPAGSIDSLTILGNTPANRRLSIDQRKRLADALAPVDEFRSGARNLGGFVAGRFPITYAQGFLGTKTHSDDVGRVRDLTHADLLERIDADDAMNAVRAWRSLYVTGQAIGDEPLIISQLIRSNIRRMAVDGLERMLAQLELDEVALSAIQAVLETDESAPLGLYAVRGERAGSFEVMETLKSGAGQKPSWDVLVHAIGSVSRGHTTASEALAMLPSNLPAQQAVTLRFINRAATILRQPVEDWGPQLAELEAESARLPTLARLMAPAILKVGDAFRRSHADLRCAMTAVAAERFRIEHNRWPESLDALVAASLLPAKPRDPFDGQPLRMKRTVDGLLIYSIGANEIDDGGQVTRTSSGPASPDLGIRLWNLDKRKQPAQ